MRTESLILGIACLAFACDGSDPSALDRAASLQIAMPDSVLFGQSVAAVAMVLDADGVEIDDGGVQWNSSNPHVLRFDEDARVKAVRPGSAIIRARARARAASATASP